MSKNYYDDVEFAEEYASEAEDNEEEKEEEEEEDDDDDEGDNHQEEEAPFILRNAIDQHDDNC